MDKIRKRRVWRWFAVPLAALAMLAVGQNTAFAQESPAPLVTEGAGDQLVISNPVWTILTGILLPIVVGLITKASANKTFQAIVGIIVAAVGAAVVRATQVDGSAIFDQALVVDIALVYIPQIAAYLGVWKNFDLNAKLAPNSGMG